MAARPSATTRLLLRLPTFLLTGAAFTAGARLLLRSPSPPPAHHDPGDLIQPVGAGHVEALAEKGGALHFFVLGEDAAELRPIGVRELQAYVRRAGNEGAVPLRLTAEPREGEPIGSASTFSGRLPPGFAGTPVSLTLSVPINNHLYRARFELGGLREEADSHAMPTPAAPAEQQRLYRTAAGLYTSGDIQANGAAPPAERFAGLLPRHDPHPQTGERICPVTHTKADPRFAWTVSGRSYLFCCPPCIDEFVQQARTHPGSVRPPEDYVHR